MSIYTPTPEQLDRASKRLTDELARHPTGDSKPNDARIVTLAAVRAFLDLADEEKDATRAAGLVARARAQLLALDAWRNAQKRPHLR